MMQRGCQHGLERAALRTCTRNARPITHFSLVSTSIREHTARSCDVRSATSDEPRKMSNRSVVVCVVFIGHATCLPRDIYW